MSPAGSSQLPSAGPSAPITSSNGGPSSSVAAAARVSTIDVNGSSHGSTTQESSNAPAHQSSINGFHIPFGSDTDDEVKEEEDRKSYTTFSTSDPVIHRAMRPRTGRVAQAETAEARQLMVMRSCQATATARK